MLRKLPNNKELYKKHGDLCDLKIHMKIHYN